MPNIKSQKKRVLTSAKAAARNKHVKSNMKTLVKKASLSVADGSKTEKAAVAEAYRVIDKAAAKGVIHKNTAARKKSAIAKKAAAIASR